MSRGHYPDTKQRPPQIQNRIPWVTNARKGETGSGFFKQVVLFYFETHSMFSKATTALHQNDARPSLGILFLVVNWINHCLNTEKYFSDPEDFITPYLQHLRHPLPCDTITDAVQYHVEQLLKSYNKLTVDKLVACSNTNQTNHRYNSVRISILSMTIYVSWYHLNNPFPFIIPSGPQHTLQRPK